MSAQYQMPREVREQITKHIGDAKPATSSLLVSLAESTRDVREHDHETKNEDWFCMNQTAWAGGKTAPVLRRLLDTDAEIQRLRARVAELEGRPSRADVLHVAAAKLERIGHSAAAWILRDDVAQKAGKDTVDGGESTRAEVERERDEVIVAWLGKKAREYRKTRTRQGSLQADVIDKMADKIRRGAARPNNLLGAPELTVYRAQHDSIVMGLYTTRQAAYEHCETHETRDDPAMPFSWKVDEDGVAELWRFGTCEGVESPTGFVVTPLTVASSYDEEADE